MKQYQISINQQTAATLDELEAVLKIPKAKIIQKGLVKLKEQFVHTFILPKKQKSKHIMDEFAGFIDLKTTKKTNFSQTVDSIYENVQR